MSLRICILASGSSGNCTFVASASSAILVDAGLCAREIRRRLEGLAVRPEDLAAVCVSHEHSDHTTGLRILSRKHGVPLYANAGTIEALSREDELKDLPWRVFTTGQPFHIGDLLVEPFSVPHDAYDPVGFVISGGGGRVGVVTDIGVATSLVRERLKHCQALVVESNHDEQMLQEARRPWHLKQRILGRQGHLSNRSAGELVAEVASPTLSHVFLAHLSQECNRHDLAVQTVRQHLSRAGHVHVRVCLTYPDRPSEIWQYNAFDSAANAVISVPA
jgi:phosphoribosyl 1,2-cyclic phosphodiesterase